MLGKIELAKFQVEAILQDYLLKAELQPRGDMQGYLNDRNWNFIPFRNGELIPLAADRRVGSMPQELTTINKSRMCVLSLLEKKEVDDLHIQITSRPAVFYFDHVAVQGQLHIRSDAPDEDLLDDLHDFYAVSEAVVFPVRPVATQPTRNVPLLFVNRLLIQTYNVMKKT